jgi:hypothetical protein
MSLTTKGKPVIVVTILVTTTTTISDDRRKQTYYPSNIQNEFTLIIKIIPFEDDN